jgi:dolichol-phosphate mannosyltransferase
MANGLPATSFVTTVKSSTEVSIGVIIPCYNVSRQIMGVLATIGPECTRVYVVDDCCPEHSGDIVVSQSTDPRVRVLRHRQNLGVGAAMVTGYRCALDEGMGVLVKIDGDGQMNPRLIPLLARSIANGEADYAKGNRFSDTSHLRGMPAFRIIGNATLSFMTKLSTGYWNVFDPTNGFTAIHSEVARRIPMEKLAPRFFFESDLLFRLALLRAKVVDLPMPARYGTEQSNLKALSSIPLFLAGHIRNFFKRLVYSYFVRDFSVASLELVFGILFCAFGVLFGVVIWYHNAKAGVFTNVGPVMLAALPIILGMQFLLAFLAYDIVSSPRDVVHLAIDDSLIDLRDTNDGVS